MIEKNILTLPMVIAALSGATLVTGQLPCDSAIRRLPAFVHYFSHCDCLRSEWTEWAAIDRKALPATQCPSLSARRDEERESDNRENRKMTDSEAYCTSEDRESLEDSVKTSLKTTPSVRRDTLLDTQLCVVVIL